MFKHAYACRRVRCDSYVTVNVGAVEERLVFQGLEGSFDVLRGILLHERPDGHSEPRACGRELAQVDGPQVAGEGTRGLYNMLRVLKTHLAYRELGRVPKGEEN
jgi:hypothetical protein